MEWKFETVTIAPVVDSWRRSVAPCVAEEDAIVLLLLFVRALAENESILDDGRARWEQPLTAKSVKKKFFQSILLSTVLKHRLWQVKWQEEHM